MVIVKRKEVTLWEKLYVGAIVKGLIFTFKNLFRKKCTRSYPEEKLAPFPEMKGQPVLVAKKDGKPRCVACCLCEYVCPPVAIYIEAKEIEDPIERAPALFEIDMTRCIMCGFCEEVCPEEAIVMSQNVEIAADSREGLVYGIDRLLVPEEKVKDRIDYIRKEFERWST
ncbi:MAG: NADH-quinone oxidoreductase subunit I [Planctomycetes bacterium]|nr:NADH-quinone oxidoreductase subunit I [Planctomycetota bacterium]